jgi:hypothetical protein
MARDKRNNQNIELFLGRLMRYLQLCVFNPKLGLSTAVNCDPVFRVCVNDPLSINVPDN